MYFTHWHTPEMNSGGWSV